MFGGRQEPSNEMLDEKSQKRHIKSTISFPYSNLEEVAGIARAIYSAGGVPMTRDQIANLLNSSPDSSTFYVKVSSARLFGVLAPSSDGKLMLTDIGHKLAGDGPEAAQARVDAFLSVELYQKLVEHFQGKRLPPPKGLESAIIAMGVSARQGDKARQAFERSASYAEYFNSTKDRLVAPVIIANAAVSNDSATPEPQILEPKGLSSTVKFGRPTVINAGFDPLIEGMLQRLPPPGTEWPMLRRAQWLRTLAANLSEVYPSETEGSIEVKFERAPDRD